MTNKCSIGERGHLFKQTHRTRAIATQRIYRGTHIRLLYTERKFNHTFTCKQHTHDTRMHAKKSSLIVSGGEISQCVSLGGCLCWCVYVWLMVVHV